ncbi:hypothetical protein F5X68DRAFT_240216 [Plectosphaerella plurivora]|uniref:Uncharacterized protein n=1 Tax=Plectosphaerella plurivora TaxID=936078 RepID=A0A9P8VAS9_9PEZI|nr:hypothetical protein F5X68DRAFT_240216 [Plectosphaerella plurivora]
MSTTNVLITGANRGVGLALTKIYLLRSNQIVIGGVRDVAAAKAGPLGSLPTATGTKLVLVKIDALSHTDPAQAVQELESQGITKLNVVIANSGIVGKEVVSVADSDPADFAEVLAVNTIGPVVLFKAVKKLLDRSENPRYIAISSTVGSSVLQPKSVNGTQPIGFGYGASKAALNHITRHMHSENPGITVAAVSPGFMNTDMGNRGAKTFGLEKPPHDVDENAQQIVKLVDVVTREKHSGQFLDFDGSELEW